jgi:hypothetical protein
MYSIAHLFVLSSPVALAARAPAKSGASLRNLEHVDVFGGYAAKNIYMFHAARLRRATARRIRRLCSRPALAATHIREIGGNAADLRAVSTQSIGSAITINIGLK